MFWILPMLFGITSLYFLWLLLTVNGRKKIRGMEVHYSAFFLLLVVLTLLSLSFKMALSGEFATNWLVLHQKSLLHAQIFASGAVAFTLLDLVIRKRKK